MKERIKNMKKLMSAMALTVFTIGTAFALPPELEALDRPSSGIFGGICTAVSEKEQPMNNSFILGVDLENSVGPIKKVNSKENLVYTSDSDDEGEEVRAQIVRQNSQENLKALDVATAQEKPTRWMRFKSMVSSVAKTISDGFKSLTKCFGAR
jgi:hypothetical protein